jgi:hypothetical protein
MMHKSDEKNKSMKPVVAPTYQSPRLTVYGAIRDLTAGGSGSQPESDNFGGTFQPTKAPRP